jgi:hypothetical protein
VDDPPHEISIPPIKKKTRTPIANIRVFQRFFVARPDGLWALDVTDANSVQGGPRRVESKSNHLLILS